MYDFFYALTHPDAYQWLKLDLKVVAVVLWLGVIFKLLNIYGVFDRPWKESPLLWRALDIIHVGYYTIVGFGLWNAKSWSPSAFILGIVFLQLIPYIVFRKHFVQTKQDAKDLNLLIGTLVIMALIMIALVYLKV